MRYWDAVGELLGEGRHALTPEIRAKLREMVGDDETAFLLDDEWYAVDCEREGLGWATRTHASDPDE